MVELKEVLEFIKNSDQSQINEIRRQVEVRRSELNYSTKSSFSVGDIVGINHKTVSPSDRFRITKIMSKNIKVEKTNIPDGHVSGGIRVSPSLLVNINK